MKKSVMTLAMLGLAAGAVSAQSSVTVSGVIDIGLEKTTGKALQQQPSKLSTSNITFKGTEDLGGGLKASFNVSHEFQGDNGDSGTPSGGTGWGNYGSWIGLSGDFGDVKIGSVFTSMFSAHQNPNGTKGGSNSHAYKVLNMDGCYSAADKAPATWTPTAAQSASCAHVLSRNTVQYTSPKLAGLTAALDVIFPENTTANNNVHGHTAAVKYAQGPLDLRFAVERGVSRSNDLVLFSASFDLSVVKLFADFENGQLRTNAAASKKNGYLVGLTAPIGSAGSVWAHLGAQAEGGQVVAPATKPADVKILGLGYKHKLSGRTTLYANYGTFKDGNSANDVTDVGFGLAHSF